MNSKQKIGLAIAALVVVATIILVLIPREESDETIRIGALLPLTGDAATYGVTCQRGMALAADQFGLSIVFEDTAVDPATAVSAYRKVTSRDGARIILGDMFSASTLAFAAMANDEGVPVISPTSSALEVPETGDFIFSIYPSGKLEGSIMAEYTISDHLETPTILILQFSGQAFEELATGFEQTVRQEQPQASVLREVISPDARDFRSILDSYSRRGIKFAYLATTKEAALTIIRQSEERQLGWRFASNSVLYDQDFLSDHSTLLDGVVFTGPVFETDSSDENVTAFVESYRTKYGHSPDVWAAYGYDAVSLAAFAIRSCKSCTGEELATLIAAADFQGLTGQIRFDEVGASLGGFAIYLFQNGELLRQELDHPQSN